ncbi:unnamed protein product [Lymnaea stagnalis]|uniref:Uncharacterized protein n=1 Tax=Lymnaea stagnalis TaxID=6523 RepID=A0AAV2HAK5_LYMST
MYKYKKDSLVTTTPGRSWSLHTSYPSIAGLHSEVQSGASARNSLITRRTSDSIMAVESIHRKELLSLDLNKKSLEHSMLAYSEKMKDIAGKKSKHSHALGHESPTRYDEHSRSSRKSSVGSIWAESTPRNGMLPRLLKTNDESVVKNCEILSKHNHLGVESETGCEDTGNRITKTITKKYPSMPGSLNQYRRRRIGVYQNPDPDIILEISESSRISDKENLALVKETAQAESDNNQIQEIVSIETYPEYKVTPNNKRVYLDADNDACNSSSFETFIRPGYWGYKTMYSPRRASPVATNMPPKLRHSPRPRKPTYQSHPPKACHHVFQYSSAVENAMLGLREATFLIDSKNNIYRSKAKLESIDLDELRLAKSLRSIRELPEIESDDMQKEQMSGDATTDTFTNQISSTT